MKPLYLFLLALLLLVAPNAQAGADLFSLSGDWRGTGAIVTEPGKPGREGRCRISAIPLVEGREIRLEGRCATDQGSAELSMRFVLYDGGVLAGGIASSTQPGTLQFIGRLDGDVARLASRESMLVGDMRATSNFTLTIADENSFRLVQWLTPEDGAPPVGMVEMDFIRTRQ